MCIRDSHSVVEGDISWTISACADGFLFWKYGLRGCGVDTSTGTCQLTFFVMYGATRVEVNRKLLVLPHNSRQEPWALPVHSHRVLYTPRLLVGMLLMVRYKCLRHTHQRDVPAHGLSGGDQLQPTCSCACSRTQVTQEFAQGQLQGPS